MKLDTAPAHGLVAAGSGRSALPEAHRARAGVLYGVAAYGLWGLFPVYFEAIKHVPTLEVLAHRIIWSVLFLALLMGLRGNWRAAVEALRSRRTLLTLTATTLLIACNWMLFIWAVEHDQLLQASLGYYINPLFNVLLGLVFLRERLRGWQIVSVALAVAGVTVLTLSHGRLPAIALVLPGTFGFYALLRKTAQVDAMVGLTIETALLAPLAAGFLIHEMIAGRAAFGTASLSTNVLLLSAGLITATPLLWFTEAARRLRLATLGFLQYLSPTGHFLLAVLAYGEPFSRAHGIAFACIWTALVIYSLDTLVRSRAEAAVATPK